MPFETALTKARDLRIPVLAGPLGRGSSAEFLGAMANSGGLGFTALVHMPEETVGDELAKVTRATNGQSDNPNAVDEWSLDLTTLRSFNVLRYRRHRPTRRI